MKINLNGHNGHAPDEGFIDTSTLDEWFQREIEREVERRGLFAKLTEETGIDIPTMLHRRCSECGESMNFTFTAEGLNVDRACLTPGGLKPYHVLLDVPSGKIVFANDLRTLVVVEEADVSVNARLGCKQTTEAHARAGMVHISVGNTCPSVFREPDGSLVVASRYIPEDDDTLSDEEYARLDAALDQTRLGSICTDLWWYSAMDHDHFLGRCAAEGYEPDDFDIFTVDVEPGVYAFTDEFPDRDAPGEVIFSRITRSQEAAPVLDDGTIPLATTFEESRLFLEIEANEFSMRMQALEYMFCTLGNGYQWINGHLRRTSRRDSEPFDTLTPQRTARHPFDLDSVPTFPALLTPGSSIYPLTWTYPGKIGAAPLDIDPWWLAAGLLFAKTAVTVPDTAFFDRHGYDHADQKAIMEAVLVYLGDIAFERAIDLTDYFAQILAAYDEHLAMPPAPVRRSTRALGPEASSTDDQSTHTARMVSSAITENKLFDTWKGLLRDPGQ